MLHVTDSDKQICLCHYPIADWYKGRHGAWHIYGHIHGSKDDVYQLMKTREHALNAAACINNYTPSTVDELIRNNRTFQEQDTEQELMFVARNKVTGEQVLFSLDDVFDGVIKKSSDIAIRPARIEDRNYPRVRGAF